VHKSARVGGVEGLSDVVMESAAVIVLAGLDLNGAQRRRARTNFLTDQWRSGGRTTLTCGERGHAETAGEDT
jgi:hypothetical protein